MLRPYLKFLIAGGIVTGEGGSALASGLMFITLSGLMNSMLSGIPYGSSPITMFTMMGIPFLVAGIVSLIIGLSLLGTGVSRRKTWLATHSEDAAPSSSGFVEMRASPREQPYPIATRVPSFEQPAIQQPASSGASIRKWCINCGAVLPDDIDSKFCPSCGNRI